MAHLYPSLGRDECGRTHGICFSPSMADIIDAVHENLGQIAISWKVFGTNLLLRKTGGKPMACPTACPGIRLRVPF